MKIKIVVDGHCIDDFSQGISTYATELYRNLEHPNLEILFCSRPDGNFERVLGDCPHLRHVPLHARSRLARYYELNRLVGRYSADFLHFQYTAPFRKKCKWIDTVHDLLFLEKAQFFPLKYRAMATMAFYLAAKRSDLLITSSSHSAMVISRYFRMDASQIRQINLGYTDFGDIAEPIQELVNKKYFLYVGRVEPRKNHVELIREFQKYLVQYPDSHLVFVGAKNLNYDEFDVACSEISDNFMHLQGLSAAELKWTYENSTGHIFPSLGEGFGFPVLESLSLGVPTASTINTSLIAFKGYLDDILVPGKSSSYQSAFRCLENSPRDMLKAEKIKRAFSWSDHAVAFADAVLESAHRE